MAAIGKRSQFLLLSLAACAAIALLVVTVIGGHRSVAQHATYLTGFPEKGAALFYGKKHCSVCHAVNGSGGRVAPDLGATAAPDLSKVAAGGDRPAWMHAMWNHAQSMIEPVTKELGAWPRFTGAEMNDLVAYVNGAPSAAIQEDGALRGSADHGWEVFQAKCIQCRGETMFVK